MSQDIFQDIDPEVVTGRVLASLLTSFKEAIVSGLSGIARPDNLQAGGFWIDTSLEEVDYTWILKLYTGTTDLEVFRVNTLTGVTGVNAADGTYSVTKISADAVGSIINFIKQRTSVSGQVLAGDTLLEIRLIGRTSTSTDPLVGYLKVVADEDQTTTNSGVQASFYSTPVGTNTATEHLKLLSGILESVLGHKLNAWSFAQDTTVGSSSMVLTSDKILTEVTGSTAVNVHGIEATATETQYKVIVNSTTQPMAIKPQSLTASAAERIRTVTVAGVDQEIIINPAGSATFWYSTQDARWKYVAGSIVGMVHNIHSLRGSYHEWVAPVTGRVRVTALRSNTRESVGAVGVGGAVNSQGDAFFWGINTDGQLGNGSVTNRSSPIAVLGGVKFSRIYIGSEYASGIDASGTSYAWGANSTGELGVGDVISRSSAVAVLGGLTLTSLKIGFWSFGIKQDGSVYAWGSNTNGQLGLGDVTPRSSPVAVLGGLKFSQVFYPNISGNWLMGIERDTGSLYAWGANTSGQLGLGDVTPRSSPVAVLGGLKFSKVVCGTNCTLGLTTSGTLYAWGLNSNGQLGLGDVTPRSSPVAVLGGLTGVVDIYHLSDRFYALLDTGAAYAWGLNTGGSLGIGDVTPRSSPVAVLGGLSFLELFPSYQDGAVAGLLSDGTLYSWGVNTNGALGVGDTTSRSSPVAVVGGLKFSALRGGSASYLAAATDGKLYAWGINTSGRLGVGDVTSRSSPTAVIGSDNLYLYRDDGPTSVVVDVVKNSTYKVVLGAGACRFEQEGLGNNVSRITIAYDV